MEKKETISNYKFTPEAQTRINKKINVREAEMDELLSLMKTRGKLRFIPEGLRGEEGGGNINILDFATDVVAHELLHGIWSTGGANFPLEKFNQDFEIAKENNELLKTIDKMLKFGPYREIDNESTAHERFAFLGAALGIGGLKEFPENLQKHYEGIFQ